MKILTAAEIREADRRTVAAGIPSLILMENAAHRVVEAMRTSFGPLSQQHVAVFCGKGNNGGDGLAIARILAVVDRPRRLDVYLTEVPTQPDALANYQMLAAVGIAPLAAIEPAARHATLVVDALLGTGANGAPRGLAREWIGEINTGFPAAKVIAVDLPSGINADAPEASNDYVRADLTVTFTAPKHAHALPPNCDRMGRLVVAPIGTRDDLLDDITLHWLTPAHFAAILGPRPRGGHKGTFGHALIVGGAQGKTGAAQMAGMAALRAGAGLVTVASTGASTGGPFPPELMTAPLAAPEFANKTVAAIGPGLGLDERVLDWFNTSPLPLVLDADALNTLAGHPFHGPGTLRVLTPHPGEMARLSPAALQPRLALARDFAVNRNVVLVLKGQRTLIAVPDGHVNVNPTGTPAMGTAGTGDILTGLLAGFLAQHKDHAREAILAAVWLHGQAGEFAAAALGERSAIATDLLQYLPDAIRHAL